MPLFKAWEGKLMSNKIHQGSSLHTGKKEFEISGVTSMRFNQFKNKYFKYRNILCADVFCGSGQNVVGQEIIDGSPIKLLNGFFNANNQLLKTKFWFSDIRGEACKSLSTMIGSNYRIKDGDINIQKMSACDAISNIGEIMSRSPGTFLYLILDPNGPKDFPKKETEELIRLFGKRLDIIPYISATTINRCIGAGKAGMDFKGWLGQIEDFDTGFVKALTSGGRDGWIRKPIPGDRQKWTMIPTFGMFKPRNDWKTRGYVNLDSEEGRETIKFYCGGTINAK
jgi:hypothetical protein